MRLMSSIEIKRAQIIGDSLKSLLPRTMFRAMVLLKVSRSVVTLWLSALAAHRLERTLSAALFMFINKTPEALTTGARTRKSLRRMVQAVICLVGQFFWTARP